MPVVLASLLAAPPLAADDTADDAAATVQPLPPVDVRGQTVPAAVDAVDTDALAGRVNRIDAEAYRARPLELADVLAQQAGLQVRRTGGFASFTSVAIRGAASDQTTVLLNGLPLAPSVTGGFNFGAVSLKDLAGVDVYAGYAPLQFAGSAPGGVINLRTGRADWDASGYLTGGSADTQTAGARAGVQTGGLRHGISLSAARSDNDFDFINPNRAFDPSDPNRQRPEPRRNADVRRVSGLYLADWSLGDDRRLDVLAQHTDQDQGLPDARNSRFARARLTSATSNLQVRAQDAALADGAVEASARGFWLRHGLTYDDRDDQIGLGQQLTDTDQRRAGGQLFARWLAHPAWRLAGVLRAERETYAADDRLSGQTDTGARNHLNAAVRTRWQARLSVAASVTLRHQHARERFDVAGARARRDTVNSTDLQAGLQWDIHPAVRAHANAGRYLRLPTFLERYGDRGLFVGNADLQAERVSNLNMGMHWSGPTTALGAELYASRLTDAIITQFDAVSGIGRASNLDSAEVVGIEGEWTTLQDLGRAGDLSVSVAAAWQHTANTTPGVRDGRQLPGRFERKLVTATTWRLPAAVELFHEYVHEAGVFYDALNSRPAPDTHRHTAGLRTVWRIGGHGLDIGMEVRNLTDDQGNDFTAQPHPGRQFFASLHWRAPGSPNP